MLREYKQFLKKIHEIVHDQMKKGHVNCDTVSEALSMTNQHLRRKIFSITGITGAVYILGIRIAYASSSWIAHVSTPLLPLHASVAMRIVITSAAPSSVLSA